MEWIDENSFRFQRVVRDGQDPGSDWHINPGHISSFAGNRDAKSLSIFVVGSGMWTFWFHAEAGIDTAMNALKKKMEAL